MSVKYGDFVTATLKGGGDCRQGAVISVEPFRIRGVTGDEFNCEGVDFATVVTDPPNTCIGCNLPLGDLCKRCEDKAAALGRAMDQAGLRFTRLELAEIPAEGRAES